MFLLISMEITNNCLKLFYR